MRGEGLGARDEGLGVRDESWWWGMRVGGSGMRGEGSRKLIEG